MLLSLSYFLALFYYPDLISTALCFFNILNVARSLLQNKNSTSLGWVYKG